MQEEGGEEKKAFASVNWVLTADELDLETEVALSFLDYLLAGVCSSFPFSAVALNISFDQCLRVNLCYSAENSLAAVR